MNKSRLVVEQIPKPRSWEGEAPAEPRSWQTHPFDVSQSRLTATKSQTQRLASLAVAMTAIAFIWLVVLPLIGEQPTVAEHIASQQRLRIDPSALFYTELEIAPAIARHVERLHDSYSGKFWTVSQPIVTAKSVAELSSQTNSPETENISHR